MSIFTKISDLQKLEMAWSHVKKNKPACGVDNITYDMFDADKKEYLKKLRMELCNHTYECLPVRKSTIYQGEKSRDIALYCMRDKIVQQSLAQEITKVFEPHFSQATIAYRPNKSALNALSLIEDEIVKNHYSYALKVDIHSFFDNIRWARLESQLKKFIHEEDVLNLIRQNSISRILDSDGTISTPTNGIHQGSILAPLMSNIYLMDFDQWLEGQSIFYVRYSDDMLILSKDKDFLDRLFETIITQLADLGLEVNKKKSVCVNLSNGIDFLGHHFDEKGKSIPQKATNNLHERLELLWLTSGLSFEDKLNKATGILDGWEQYFREERSISSIIEYAAIVNSVRMDAEAYDRLKSARFPIINIYKDIALYLAELWKENNDLYMELFEYEQFFKTPVIGDEQAFTKAKPSLFSELATQYRKLLIQQNYDTLTEIMQIYTDLGNFENASYWLDEINRLDTKEAEREVPFNTVSPNNTKPMKAIEAKSQMDSSQEIAIEQVKESDLAEKVLKHFAGREDLFSEETLVAGAKRSYEIQLQPLTEQMIFEHLNGERTLGTYIQRPNHTVKFIIIDVDISKRMLLKYDRTTPEFQECLSKAFRKALEIVKLYRKYGLEGYIEYSGFRGFHVWLLFTEWIPVRYANMFCDHMDLAISHDDDVTFEYFPNKTAVRPGKYGQCIKLPFGKHIRSQEYSYFIDSDGNKITRIHEFIDGLARFQLSAIKRILAEKTEFQESINRNLEFDYSELGNLPVSVKTVLDNCNLMKFLCKKACTSGYLSHFERMSLLYVFGHLGEDGKEFIHLIMSKTMNYQYQVTEKFIRKIPEKPISCLKLREQYKSLTAEYGCSCSFKRSKNCYPSPVLHAISLSTEVSEQITIPTSRTLTAENEKKMIEELNIHKKAEELARKILELKKQRRKIDASVIKLENELSKIFDSEQTDSLEIEMGLLLRRRKDERYEWLIEI